MKKYLLLFLIPILLIGILFLPDYFNRSNSTGAPPYNVSGSIIGFDMNDVSSFVNWKRPEGPVKIALQVGHWKTEEAPEEQKRLRDNSGASGGGKSEWEVNMAIAQATSERLKNNGLLVEILPTTVPPDYWADVFISIHADGSENPDKTGFKAAGPWRDMSGKSDKLLSFIETNYQNATKLEIDPNVTRNMRGYYAFRWWRYEHSIHPMTPAIILETGFLSSPSDRLIIVDQPELAADGISKGILEFLESENLIKSR